MEFKDKLSYYLNIIQSISLFNFFLFIVVNILFLKPFKLLIIINVVCKKITYDYIDNGVLTAKQLCIQWRFLYNIDVLHMAYIFLPSKILI